MFFKKKPHTELKEQADRENAKTIKKLKQLNKMLERDDVTFRIAKAVSR